MLSFLGPLLVAALTGETILAYRHPKEFNYLATLLIGILGFSILYMQGWDISNDQAKYAVNLDDFKDYALYKKTVAAIEEKQFSWWCFWVAEGTLLYTLFLNNLRYFIVKPEKG